MRTPPPVSGDAYPTEVGSTARSNYLRGGFALTTAYGNNVVGQVAVAPVSDFSYSIFPTIEIDKTTSRMHLMLTYSPSITIYQHTSSANQSGQSLMMNFQYRLSPHVSGRPCGTTFKRPSNVFNQQDALSGPPVSGSPQPPVTGAVDLVADLLGNQANAELTYQFSRNGMVGLAEHIQIWITSNQPKSLVSTIRTRVVGKPSIVTVYPETITSVRRINIQKPWRTLRTHRVNFRRTPSSFFIRFI